LVWRLCWSMERGRSFTEAAAGWERSVATLISIVLDRTVDRGALPGCIKRLQADGEALAWLVVSGGSAGDTGVGVGDEWTTATSCR